MASPTAFINAQNVVVLNVDVGPDITLKLDFSLQRHHYSYIHLAASAPVNSILHHDVQEETLRLEALEINPLLVRGSQVEALDALLTWRQA